MMKSIKHVIGLLVLFVSCAFVTANTEAAGKIIINHLNWNPSSIDISILDSVRNQKIMFSHMSVGGDIIGGLEDLSSGNSARYGFQFADSPSRVTVGVLYHWYNSLNNYPIQKLENFDSKMHDNDADGNDFGSMADIAYVKFCYTDIEPDGVIDHGQDIDSDGDLDENDIYIKYMQIIESLRQAYPNCKFVFVTSPLTTEHSANWEIRNALMKHNLNEHLRTYVNENGGYLFDLADIEAHDNQGNPVTFQNNGNAIPMLWTGWARDRGHLNDAGSERIAYGMWSLWAAIVQDGGGNVPPVADASSDPSAGIEPLTVSFTGAGNDPDGTIVSYHWDFGDGGTSDNQNPTYIFNNAGTYTATLTVTDNGGLQATDTCVITVEEAQTNVPPTVDASGNPGAGTAPLTVSFTGAGNDPDGTIVSYHWDFGDGGTSDNQNPTYIFNNAGTYTATLTVTDNGGLQATDICVITVYVEAAEKIIINHLNWNPSSIDISVLDSVRNQKIMFSHMSVGGNTISGLTDLASNNPTRYGMEFTIDFPKLLPGYLSHWWNYLNNDAFRKIEDFDTKLRSDDSEGYDFGATADIVYLYGPGYTDLEPSDVENYSEDLDSDGDKDEHDVFIKYISTMESLIADYPYTTFVFVTCSRTVEHTANWEINNARMQFNFNEEIRSYVQSNGGYLFDIADIECHDSNGDLVYFEDGGEQIPMLWTGWWTDGSRGHLNPDGRERVAYAMWSLWAAIVQDGGGGGNVPPVADASGNPGAGTAPLTVSFTGAGNDPDGTIVSYHWDFGDGGSSDDQNPTHVFNSAGTYTATLTVTDNGGLQATDTCVITVEEAQTNVPPVADASGNPGAGTAPLTVSFTGAGNDPDGTIVSYHWDFGDGGSSDDQNPTHVFNSAGTYTATLTVTDNGGLQATDTCVITVEEAQTNVPPTVDASGNPGAGTAPLTVSFTGAGNDPDGTIVSYHWDFGDGGSSDDQNPTHVFNSAGTYTATLTVTDNGGLQATDTLVISVLSSGTNNTYYIDGANGNDSWNGLYATPTGGANGPWKTINAANTVLGPGDTVLIRTGTYSESIRPSLSGNENKIITYEAYPNEVVTITGSSICAINLSNRNYIKISGISIENVSRFIEMEVSYHNIIESCIFFNAEKYSCSYLRNAHHNQILQNSFSCDTDNFSCGDLLKLVSNNGPDTFDRSQGDIGSDHNIIEGNHFGNANHSALTVRGKFNIIRGNVFENAREKNVDISWQNNMGSPWAEGDAEFNVFEHNVVRNAGPDFRYSGLVLASSHNIVRFNEFYNNIGDGIEVSTFGPSGDTAPYADNNRIYHNLIYKQDKETYANSKWQYNNGIACNDWYTAIRDTRIFNNVLYKNHAPQIYGFDGTTVIGPNQENGDPLFINEENYDFHLSQGSTYIDSGIPIAIVVGGDSGTIVTVSSGDAYNFSDGHGVVPGDTVWINKREAIVIDIDYENNKITLDRPLSWENADEITFPYQGSGPDIGAHEYISGNNTPPVANAGADQSVEEGIIVTLNGSGSSDSDGQITSYLWEQIDGTSVELNNSSGVQASFMAPDVDGSGVSLTFTLIVTDDGGLQATDTCVITVEEAQTNNPPMADASSDPSLGTAPLTVSFTGAGNDPDGTIVSYHWDFGDGGSSDDQNPTHVFNSAGTYTATLTVTDNGGLQATDTCVITVEEAQTNVPPTVDASSNPGAGTAPLTVSFTGAGNDPDGTIVSYHWDFGDGGSSDDQNPTHVFNSAGTYTATLTVTDNGGLQASDTVTINVTPENVFAYYVSINGSDSPGANPFRTVNYAISQASDGDTIYIMPGNYNLDAESRGYINVNGKNNLTICAADPNNRPVLYSSSDYGVRIFEPGTTVANLILDHGGPHNHWKTLIEVDTTENAQIVNCVTRYGYHGIVLRDSKKIEVINCVSYGHGYNNGTPEDGNGHGFLVYNSNSIQPVGWDEKILFKDCEAYDNGGDGFQSSSSPTNRKYSSYIEFDSCNFHDNQEDAFDFKDSSHVRIHDCVLYDNMANGIVTHSNISTSHGEVWNNEIYGNGWWGAIITDNCNNWIFYNNLIYNNSADQSMYSPVGLKVNTSDSSVYHNVFYNNTRCGYLGNAEFKNNALCQNGTGASGNIGSNANGSIEYNYVYPSFPGKTGDHAVTDSNAGFVDVSSYNFDLVSTSILRDAGVNVGIAYDIQNIVRPYGSNVDIGAFEWHGSDIFPRDVTNQHQIGFDGSNLELGWTNPTTYDEYGELIPENQDFEGVMIRYNVGSDAPYPANHTEGTLFKDEPGNLDEFDSCEGAVISETYYKFSFFSHDADGHYSTTVHLLVDTKLPLVNVPPIINSFTGVPSSLNNPGETITLNAFATDPDGDSLTYTINFGDGTASESGSEVVHTYASAGTYTAEVSVDDGHDHIVGESLQIAVNDVPPAKPTSVTVK